MPRRSRVLLLALAVLTAALPLLHGGVRDALGVAIEYACVGLCWYHLLPQRDLHRKGWVLVVAGATLTATADAAAALEVNVLHLTAFPRPSTVIVLVGYATLGAGAVMFDRRRVRVPGRGGGIDSAIFGLGGLAPVLAFLVLPQFELDGPLGGRLAVAGYALADLMIVTVIARLLLTDSTRSLSLVMLGVALGASLAGDLVSGVTSFQGSHSTSAVVAVLWLVGYLALAAGIAHPSLRGLTYGTYADAERVTPRAQVALLAVGLLLPGTTLAISLAIGDTRYLWVLVVIGLVVAALVALRITRLIDHIGRQSDQLSQLARSDELTGLPNRRSWNHTVARACDVATSSGEPLCIALFDLDRFKQFNDLHGHAAGDSLLREVSTRWSQALVGAEFVARYGGEEFAVLLPGTTLAVATERVEQLRQLVPGPESASAGVSLWLPGTDPALTVAEADGALYLAKRTGRARTVAAETGETAPGPLRDLLTVVQPIVRLSDLSVVGHEALSRFPHTTDIEAVYADAHDKGYGDLLEVAAVRRVIERTDRPAGTALYVNVSERAMRSDRFWEGLPADLHGVVVELSEHRDGLDDEAVAVLLDRLRERGARIGLDDVGSASTDFARVASLLPDVTKIDRSLVAGCDQHPSRADVLRMIIGFARERGIEVCAEGVETVGELQVVTAAGATYAQGYLLGRPQQDWVSTVSLAALT